MRNYVSKNWFRGKEHRMFKYPSDIDEELIPMLDVFNNIPGMRTQYCCCGHGEDGWYMVFEFTSDFMYDKALQFFRGICNSECHLGLDFEVLSNTQYASLFDGVPEREMSIYCNPLGRLSQNERAKKYAIICEYFSKFAIKSLWGNVQEFYRFGRKEK